MADDTTLRPFSPALPTLVVDPFQPVAEIVKGWQLNKTQRHLADRIAEDRRHDRETYYADRALARQAELQRFVVAAEHALIEARERRLDARAIRGHAERLAERAERAHARAFEARGGPDAAWLRERAEALDALVESLYAEARG